MAPQGTFERVGAADAESHEAAAEHAKHHPKSTATYQLKATGAIITTPY